jgi:hypothetical protein
MNDKETYRSAVVGGSALVLGGCVHCDICIVGWVWIGGVVEVELDWLSWLELDVGSKLKLV